MKPTKSELEITPITPEACYKFMLNLAQQQGTVLSIHKYHNGFPDTTTKQRYHSLFITVQFPSESHRDEFTAMGWKLEEVEIAGGC